MAVTITTYHITTRGNTTANRTTRTATNHSADNVTDECDDCPPSGSPAITFNSETTKSANTRTPESVSSCWQRAFFFRNRYRRIIDVGFLRFGFHPHHFLRRLDAFGRHAFPTAVTVRDYGERTARLDHLLCREFGGSNFLRFFFNNIPLGAMNLWCAILRCFR